MDSKNTTTRSRRIDDLAGVTKYTNSYRDKTAEMDDAGAAKKSQPLYYIVCVCVYTRVCIDFRIVCRGRRERPSVPTTTTLRTCTVARNRNDVTVIYVMVSTAAVARTR